MPDRRLHIRFNDTFEDADLLQYTRNGYLSFKLSETFDEKAIAIPHFQTAAKQALRAG